LLAALTDEFARTGIELPLYWGNRNWEPYAKDVVARMRDDGVRRAIVLATSATSSYSSCRQYREDMALAEASVDGAVELVKLRHFFDHPGFVAANIAGVQAALASLPEDARGEARLVFTAHSVPETMDASSGPARDRLYSRQQREVARLVAEAVRGTGADFDMVWQSRSGPPSVPWLAPDINDHLRTVAAGGTRAVVVCPTGFVSDHMEVLWDLDNEARETASDLGLAFARAATAGTHPAFVAGIADLVREQIAGTDEHPHLGSLGVCGLACPADCCPAPQRRPAA
jgi:ferrochelatase